MRPVIISLILFCTMLIGIYSTTGTMTNQLESICRQLETVEEEILSSDWPSAINSCEMAYTLWQEKHTLWHLVFDQQEVSDLESNFMRVNAYLKANDFAQGLAELNALKSQYQHLLSLEEISWKNIF